jgi:hypothetical protein
MSEAQSCCTNEYSGIVNSNNCKISEIAAELPLLVGNANTDR